MSFHSDASLVGSLAPRPCRVPPPHSRRKEQLQFPPAHPYRSARSDKPRKNTDETGSSCAIKTSLRLWPPHPKVPCATQECTHAFKRPEGPFKLSRRSSSTSQTLRSPQAALLPDRGVSTACEEKDTVRAARYCVVQTRLVISSRCNTSFLPFLD